MRRMLPGTRALRTFEAAGRHLNFTRAAEELGLTPAAVSFQIREIEDQLGITLFTRTSRKILLTSAGTVLFEATSDALDNLHQATGRAQKMARGATHLRLSLGARFATHWFLPRLSRFREANPDLELTFDITDRVRDFDIDDVDAAIRFGTGNYAGTRSERLFDTLVVPVCSPELLETGPTPKEPQDLLHHTLCHVDCQTEGMVWPSWSTWMAAAGIDNFDDSRCVAFTDSSHVVQAVTDGNAIGLVELEMVENDLAQGRMVRLFDIGVSVAEEYAYHLVYPENSGEEPGVRALRQWVSGEVQRMK
ncbi:transcriptional regulator GcvA [Microbulbifer halophilus]|uniref:Transcriptional regulator GcvA n=1 Tax=Microbulbifer halophilus TaxID=453963 RepID=A0ABW5E9B0_9GAMM|nr:transcriptional regulator GcvA [Microbulbifer halophilus]MCW8126465.1 transcriptional regulator GcvA [Microbulbifer halophilus]